MNQHDSCEKSMINGMLLWMESMDVQLKTQCINERNKYLVTGLGLSCVAPHSTRCAAPPGSAAPGAAP